MIRLDPPLRLAMRRDARALAELVNFAGEGLPLHLWTKIAGPRADPWEIGRERQEAKVDSANIVVVDEGDGVLAAMTGYVVGPEPEPVTDEMPPLFRPLQELENLAPESWYVNVLAAYPHARGRGYGTRLLQLADEFAREAGLDRLSIIVADLNDGARRLYERRGFSETARRPMVKEGWPGDGEEWVLLMKRL